MNNTAEQLGAKTVELKAVSKGPRYKVNKLAVPTLQGYTFIQYEEIASLKADGSYTAVNLVSGETLIVSKILKDIAAQLSAPGFIRVHRSFIVNLNYISQYFKGKSPYLVMDNGSRIEVSSTGKKVLLKALNIF